ncbi:MAG: potassium channel family protein, partial [Nocardiopsaceae bacterium]|nr:potassium channel family protein [Nocardiopsaceae bacterium]
ASAFFATSWVAGLQVALFVVVTALALRNGLVARRVRRAAIAAVVAGSAVAVVLALTTAPDVAVGAANLWGGLLLLLSVVLILRRVLAQPRVTIQSIFGAVSTYLVIGLMYAEFYAAISRFGRDHFFVHGMASVKTYQYFSFTTLTTLGYGDFTAAGSLGRAVAVLEAMTGQIFLATLVARLVATFQPMRRTRRGSSRGASASSRRRSRHRQPVPRGRPAAAQSGRRGRTGGVASTPGSLPGRARPGRK